MTAFDGSSPSPDYPLSLNTSVGYTNLRMASDSVSIKKVSSPRNISWGITRFKDSDGVVAKFTKSGHSATEAALRFPERLINKTENGPNGLTNYGKTLQWNLFIGALANTGSPEYSFDFNSARLGVSDDTTAFDASQNFLDTSYDDSTQTATNNFYAMDVDATFPQVSGDTIIFQATFSPGIAEWATGWQSFGVDNDGSNWDGSKGWTLPTADFSAVASYENSGAGGATAGIGLYNRFVSNQAVKGALQTWILTLNIQQT